MLFTTIACDPTEKSCFVSDCSVDNDPECDVSPYMKVEINAHQAPKCLEEHTCEAFVCTEELESCSITYCSEDTIEEGEICFENSEISSLEGDETINK